MAVKERSEIIKKAKDQIEILNQSPYSRKEYVFKNKETIRIAKDDYEKRLEIAKSLGDVAEIQKATVALTDLSSGGLLAVEQETSFVDLLKERSVLLRDVRLQDMPNPTFEISKRKFSGRMFKPASQDNSQVDAYHSGRSFTELAKSKPTLSKVTLSTVEIMAHIEFPYEVLEDNIERGTFMDETVREAAGYLSRDLEDMIINGDTTDVTDATGFLALRNGVLALTTTNVYDHGGAQFSNGAVSSTLKTLPVQYHQAITDYRLYAHPYVCYDYQSQLSSRQTLLGDQTLVSNLVGTGAFRGFGSTIIMPTDRMPLDKATFLNPQNVVVGFHRQMTYEMDKDIERRVYKVVITARVDLKLQEEEAVVKIINLG